MKSAGWCAYMQSQLEREERQKEYERKRAEREAWKMEHMSSESCPYAEEPCISVKVNTVNSLAVAIILIARERKRLNEYGN